MPPFEANEIRRLHAILNALRLTMLFAAPYHRESDLTYA